MAQQIFSHQMKVMGMEHTRIEIWGNSKTSLGLRLKASASPPGLTQEITKDIEKTVTESSAVHFSEMKQRFLTFKKEKYLKNLNHYENLADNQSPKFLVIACADSRVCPSSILGFQPGEAFVVRNVANLVPPYERPTETNAALEFAVNTLKVENILVIGHSCCGGIRALISMPDDDNSSSFIKSWVVVGKNARLRTKAVASDLSLDEQCRHCEKESINQSLQRLLSYPWIQDKVRSGTLSIHGGYYDFTNCTFEKWTLEYGTSSSAVEGEYRLRSREFWS